MSAPPSSLIHIYAGIAIISPVAELLSKNLNREGCFSCREIRHQSGIDAAVMNTASIGVIVSKRSCVAVSLNGKARWCQLGSHAEPVAYRACTCQRQALIAGGIAAIVGMASDQDALVWMRLDHLQRRHQCACRTRLQSRLAASEQGHAIERHDSWCGCRWLVGGDRLIERR